MQNDTVEMPTWQMFETLSQSYLKESEVAMEKAKTTSSLKVALLHAENWVNLLHKSRSLAKKAEQLKVSTASS